MAAALRQALHQAQQLAQQGQWATAELELAPFLNFAPALHLLGGILKAQGRYPEAFEIYERALAAGALPEVRLELAELAFAQGKPDWALAFFQAALKQQLSLSDSQLHMYARSLAACGQWSEAEGNYLNLLTNHPNQAGLWVDLAQTQLEQQHWSEARQALEKALQLQPDSLTAGYNLAFLHMQLGELKAAQHTLSQLLTQAPKDLAVRLLQAQLFFLQADYSRALQAYQQLSAEYPAAATIWNQLGLSAQKLQQAELAEQAFQQSLDLQYDPEVQANLAQLQRERCQPEQALKSLQQASQKSAQLAYQAAFVLPPVFKSAEQLLDWQGHLQSSLARLEQKLIPLQDPFSEVGHLPFYLPYLGLDDKALMQQLVRIFSRACPGLKGPELSFQAAEGPLKIGLVSGYFREHTVYRLFGHLLQSLTNQGYPLTLLSLNPQQDAITQQLSQQYSWVQLPRQLKQARQVMASLNLDVLLYLDLNMDPLSWYLAFAQLAPVQLLTWGHGITSGHSQLDGFISSQALETPFSASQAYTEPLLQLPGLLGAWQPGPAAVGSLPWDLPAGHRYVCPQSLYKFHPEFDPLLAGLLAQDPQGQLILIEGLYPEWRQQLELRWQNQLDLKRVHWLPRLSQQHFLALLAACDVMLDPRPFGGGLTTMQALSLGLPVVTWPGELLKNRIALAVCQQMNWWEGVASGPEDYLKKAQALAGQMHEQAERLKSGIRAKYLQSISEYEQGQNLGKLIEKIYWGKWSR